jgi:predicted dehydrogenase
MTLKFAIAGAGYIANYHARAIQELVDAKIIAVVEKFPEKGIPFGECHEIPQHYLTIEEMVEAGGIDALVIGTPNFLHAPQAITALHNGIHVMVEKPMAMNGEEAEQMIEAAMTAGRYLMVAHCWRFDEEVLWLKNQVDSGKIGRVFKTKGYGVHTHWGPSGWFTQKALSGGGALVDMGIHAIDTARFLLGDPQPESVYARISTNFGDSEVDDSGILIINWENGTTSMVESGWWQPHMDGPEASTQLYGTRGFGNVFPTLLEIPDVVNQRIEVIDAGYPHPRTEHCPQAMYSRQMAYFSKCIRDQITPNPGGEEGLVNMRILDAAYESATSDEVVVIQ